MTEHLIYQTEKLLHRTDFGRLTSGPFVEKYCHANAS